ncbi:transmembrane protein, putative (macronuclear) [Tetrahymena thermophila SB210]|uniref:Transmembrane protein, putative n=1 Tax=Tetrahymena thermophila (strain SB210) TaxID=312017 RepID=Q22RQ1_TETTS|nr:transmembrane protein, putative [Tetrahymena thermophila SB210]EAR88071.1 transmembrane protein, putative [Tetrahymena thermophila SB210]|eukprot:XP_001008316.1 transmembrane protein, putative [Tetrahymena thermophila SB210]
MLSGFIGTECYNLTALQNNQKEMNAKKNEKEYLMFLIILLERVVLSFGLMFIKIKIYFSNMIEKYHSLYKIIGEIYEINFVAGEEDAKLRERLRKKFDFSFFEFENGFEPHEDELLQSTFENTVYNALYISEQRQAQLKKMNFAPKIQVKQIEYMKKSLSKDSKNQIKVVSFNLSEQAELNDTQQLQVQN